MAIKPTPRITTSSKSASKPTPKAPPKPPSSRQTRVPSTSPSPSPSASTPATATATGTPAVTPFQTRVYALLAQIPAGRVSTYAALARALNSSPRAVGGALRRNPFAPEVPCHRVVASDGFVGGFKGEWQKAPSGINQTLKLKLLGEEGVRFTEEGRLIEGWRGGWDAFKIE